ncbi:PAS domain-containing protein [Leptospira meyeri]|uniref:PAS domain-containing protein n=1 Tax=Leptospira meyeri TaxID=29508 RepID=UPI00108355BF|nr:PAS domain-containing protein [Leptospira meyeri]TGM61001.1 PAS domain-containing protein [Leptospira meyeri]TGM66070.1 PAS domain-containing protein [Leptospira meyeri]
MSKFIDQNIIGKLGTLTQSEADAASFGIVKVDSSGKILLYNKYESELANVPIQTAVGKNFFTEVAICTNNRIFYGRFKEGIVSGDLDIAFNYVFTYKMKPTNVVIHLYHDHPSNTNWIFVKLR